MNDFHNQLLTTFKNQYLFSRDYSPLYASLFAAVASWLAEEPPDPLGAWLLKAAHGRRPLDVSLLLAAGVHRDILLERPELSALTHYFPSAGGTLSAGRAVGDDWHIDGDFKRFLKRSILARRDDLQAFIQSSQVQTNETGRGLSWLLPVSLAGWPRVHLLDLGASAGLNLAAEKRSYQFVDTKDEQAAFHLGEGKPVQFEVRSNMDSSFPYDGSGEAPQVLSRLGCDMNPFFLRTTLDEVTLASFIWADQVARMNRLQEGLAAYRQVEVSSAPIELHAVELPHELPDFLEQHILEDDSPLVCYNTYIRMYLPQKGFALRGHLGEWARKQDRPVVWVQWEPPSSLNERHGEGPEYGWLAWTIDMWHRDREYHWHIAWTHPHGQQKHWLPGLKNWINTSRSLHIIW